MGLIFRKEHLRPILDGVKIQTRRRHRHRLKAGKVYEIKRDWFHETVHRLLTRVYSQRLGEIRPAEDGYTIEEFKEVWKRIIGPWDPDEVVVVYEFKLHSPH